MGCRFPYDGLFFCLFLFAASSYAGSTPASLLSIIKTLQEEGHQILYSSSLVTEEQLVTVDKVSITDLRNVLPTLGLQLKQIGTLWVISKIEGREYQVSGYIVSPRGDPITTAYIRGLDSGKGATSGDKGDFTFEGLDVEEAVVIGALGFEEQFFPPGTFSEGENQLGNVVLQPIRLMENVIVTGSLYRFPYRSAGSSLFNLSADEINSTPSLAGDAMRIVNRLPGVSSVGVTAKPRIRGGLQDEVLILLDGVELLEPFHLSDYQAGFSSIDSRTVDTIDIYTGGFPIRYGNRMSGVIDVKTHRAELPFNTEIGLSNLSAFINTRGQTDSADWLASVRRGDLEELTQFIDSRATDPRYSDASGRIRVILNERMEWTLGGLVTNDNISFSDDEETASSKVDNNYLWSRLDTKHNKKLHSSLIIAYAGIDREKQQSSFEEEGKGGFLGYSQDVRQFSLRNDYSFAYGQHFLEFGFQAAYGRSEYDYRAEFDRGLLAELLGNEQLVNEDIKRKAQGWFGGAYVAAEYALSNWLFQPSMRWDLQRYYFKGQSHQLSPRLGLAYEIDQNTTLRFSVGRFHQPEGIHELQVLDGEQQFFRPQRSDQMVLGLDWQRSNINLKAELYYKRYRDLKPRFENVFNPFVLLPEMEPDRVRLAPEKAMARGVDLELKYQFTPEVRGILRYSYMNVEDRISGAWVPRRWSQSDAWSAQLSWRRKRFTLAAAIGWHSGWRTSVLQSTIPVGTVVPVESVLNNAELRNYLSLDISASKSWQVGKTLVTFHADITNVTERDNLAGVDFDVEEEGGAIIFIPDNETLLPLIPSVGVIIAF